ncbi:hypothetical protein I4F81_006387 [Pyropia yezoensis]|uniref:Uncharacterized protein n=1 Tax=Pyropia yezoensis TaxID=2788 RepID=A0ACC3C1V3_PYRYE|nr:hypothetical protein I4F81_006387 [Neopyropia yezoensis]
MAAPIRFTVAAVIAAAALMVAVPVVAVRSGGRGASISPFDGQTGSFGWMATQSPPPPASPWLAVNGVSGNGGATDGGVTAAAAASPTPPAHSPVAPSARRLAASALRRRRSAPAPPVPPPPLDAATAWLAAQAAHHGRLAATHRAAVAGSAAAAARLSDGLAAVAEAAATADAKRRRVLSGGAPGGARSRGGGDWLPGGAGGGAAPPPRARDALGTPPPEAAARVAHLVALEAAAAPFRTATGVADKRARLAIKKRLNLAVNQIAGSVRQVGAKATELVSLLAAAAAHSPAAGAFAASALAERLAAEGDARVASSVGAAYAIAAVAVGVCLPGGWGDGGGGPAGVSAEEAEAAFRAVLGFRDGERVEGYTDRMCGYMALYAAVAQTELPPGVVAAVAAVAAEPPGRLDGPAGYGKLLLALRQALVVRPPPGAPPAATSRLDALVDEYLDEGGRGGEPPPGRDLPLADTVINA